MPNTNFDFSGYATKNNLKCSDGRTILKDAFKHQNGQTVPLVWQHLHDEPANVLGHATLENREDGVYCYGTFNETTAGQNAKELVAHGDISHLSIYANQLKEQSKKVMHGAIREVSLVLAGANPGALIENVNFAHSDGSYTPVDDEAIIYTDDDNVIELSHAASTATDERTVAEVFDTLNEEQKTVVYAMIAHALDAAEDDDASHSDIQHEDGVQTIQDVFDTLNDDQKTAVYAMIAHALEVSEEDDINHSNEEGDSIMKNNVFEQSAQTPAANTLTHDQLREIVVGAKRYGSLKESFIAHTTEYGFTPIDVLFPEARLTNQNGPETYKRPDAWATQLLGEATHTPFARLKTQVADLTADEARAKGYITGNLKKEEVIPLMKRITTPTTVYKKQKLDRDDMIDITDFDVVVWLKNEMRGMLDEELARAILIGDGRDVSDEDKINEQNIRPIALDNDSVYIHRAEVESTTKVDDIIDEFIRQRQHYRGTGSPTLWTSTNLLTEMLLVKDAMGRRLYSNVTELASVLRVSKIVEVELMNNATRKVNDTQTNQILGVVVNMKDYSIGADKGGQISMFDDFDIDYNQHKYLIETRISGALTRPKSALIIEMKP